ncbi:MAG TPA: glycosyltransferase family 4 protein [Candidatus Limnocylindria bacterium]|nr:glycosyltransferase family 4 protein [Candidatus Limnocylindria bacterium]
MSSRRLRILVVDHVTKVMGGAEVNLVELLGHCDVRERWETQVACRGDSPLDKALVPLGCQRHDYGFGASLNELRIVGRGFSPMAKFRGWQEMQRARVRLREIIDAVQPEIVLSCTNKDHFVAGAAAQSTEVRSVWWVNDLLTRDFFSWPIRGLFAIKARSLARRLAPVSDCGKAALIREGVPAKRIVTIHNGIPLEKYKRDEGRPLRSELGVMDGEPLFGILGRLTPWKGQDRFLELAEAWKAAGLPGRFAIIGRAFNEEAHFETALRAYVRDRRLERLVHFVPFQSNVAAVLSSLDVLVHMSVKPEPFGRVLIEAMAVGTPVLASRGGGVPEIVTEGLDGELAEPGAVPEYLAKLRKMSAPGSLAAYAQNTRATVKKKFSLDRVVGDFSNLFSALR